MNRIPALIAATLVVAAATSMESFAMGPAPPRGETSGGESNSAQQTFDSASHGGAFTGDAQNKMGKMLDDAFSHGHNDPSGSSNNDSGD
jgi:hypothetical protein